MYKGIFMGNFNDKLRTSFSAKLGAILTAMCILILLCFTGVKYIVTSSDSGKTIKNSVNSELNTISIAAESYMGGFAQNVRAMTNGPVIKRWLANENNSGEVSALCGTLAESSSDVSSVWVIRDSSGEFVSQSSTGMVRLSDAVWYNSLYLSNDKLQVFTLDSGIGTNEECVAVISAVTDNDRVIGFVGEEIPLSKVREFFGSFDLPAGKVVITDPSGKTIFSGGSSDSEEADPDSESFFSLRNCEKISRWDICIYADYKEFSGRGAEAFSKEVLLLMALLVLMIAVILNVVRHECRHIPQISRSIAEISAGNYNFRINDSSDNEIGLIARSVDDLACTLQEKNALIDEYSNTDIQTGAKNRVKMYEAIEDFIVSRDETRPRFGIIFFDIDNFRWINETLGHRYGDMLLKEFADRLKIVFDKVYRFGSDMFTAIVDIEEDTSVIDEKIESLNDILGEPITIITSPLYIRCSEGIAIYPDDGTSADTLLRCAEIALGRSKEKGKNRLSYFSRSQHNRVTDKAAISQLLTHALEKGELYLNYQPIISTADRSLHGFEVLLRWESEELGFVPPSKFVEIAEETGEIVKIGTWIFETGCRFLKQLNEYNKDVIMSINVSPVQLSKHDFMDNVLRTLEVTHVNPSNIQVEITETSLVNFADRSSEYIKEMSRLGLGIALDDFGTGYASLNYLKEFPISCLKVDKSFVDNIASGENDYKITDSIIDMVHSMGIKTVAEGVETMAQYNSIVGMECDYIQGFLMSKPMAESAALEFVRMYDEMYKPDNRRLLESEMRLLSEKG